MYQQSTDLRITSRNDENHTKRQEGHKATEEPEKAEGLLKAVKSGN